MSASASKKRRIEAMQQAQTTAAAKKKAEDQKKKKRNILFCAVAALVVLLIVGLALISRANTVAKLKEELTPKYDTSAAVATVGEEQVSVPFYDYFFYQVVNSGSYSFSTLANYGLLEYDVPLAEQSFNGQTAEQFYIEQTNQTIQQYMNLYTEAKANGQTLSDEQRDLIDQTVANMRKNVSSGIYDLNYYLSTVMGSGCNEDNYRDYLEMLYIVEGYETRMKESFEPSAEEIAKEYAENAGAYDLVYYASYTVQAEGTEETVESEEENAEPETKTVYTEEALAQAKADADAAAAAFPEAEAVSSSGNQSMIESSFNEEIAAWLYDSARKAGDIEVFFMGDEVGSYKVVRFDRRETNDYHRVNGYVVRLPITTDENGSTQAQVEANVKNFLSGVTSDMSEEDFAARVTEFNLLGDAQVIGKNTFSQDITDFVYDSSRKFGDIETFTTDSMIYIVRYHSLEEDVYRDVLVHDALYNAAHTAWSEEVTSRNEIVIDEKMFAYTNTNMTIQNPYSVS